MLAHSLRDYPVFDVSWLVGHRDLLKSRSDFSVAFVRQLAKAARDARQVVPALQPTPAGRLHFTLRSVYGNRPPSFSETTSAEARRRRYAETRLWVHTGTRKVVWLRYAVTQHHILILEGRAVGLWLTKLRGKMDRTSDKKPRYPASGFCHIVVARPKRALSRSELTRFREWASRQPLVNRRMELRRPVLLFTKNHFGTKYGSLMETR